ncbi:MAG: SufD family Fe-S cluster assembly protein [bacterium]|nr:SufD family Fe-S cluster assembly protein [bacterium]
MTISLPAGVVRELVLTDNAPSRTIIAEEGSTTTVFDRGGLGDHHVTLTIKGDARVEYAFFSDHGGTATIMATLEQPGASLAVTVTTIGAGEEILDCITTIFHAAPHTESAVTVRSVLFDQASMSWSGMTHLSPEASASRGYQRYAALLLGSGSSAHPNPQLRIENNQVACGHAASVGHLDPEQLFYAMSRGFTKENAEHAIIEGFIAPDASPWNKDIRESLRRCIQSS